MAQLGSPAAKQLHHSIFCVRRVFLPRRPSEERVSRQRNLWVR
jgi:hypothetical protein